MSTPRPGVCDGRAVIAPLRAPALARAWFLLTAVLVVVAIAVQLPVSAGEQDGFFDVPAYRALNLFAYFTIQSNILVAIASTALAQRRAEMNAVEDFLADLQAGALAGGHSARQVAAHG